MTTSALTWRGVIARRMARNALTAPATDSSLADIAGVMCGVHAQVLSAAELSIGRRIAGGTRSDVQRAPARGQSNGRWARSRACGRSTERAKAIAHATVVKHHNEEDHPSRK